MRHFSRWCLALTLTMLTMLSVFVGAGAAEARDGEGLDDLKPKPQTPKQPDGPAAQGKKPDEPAPPIWEMGVFGYLRLGYENVQKDARYDFVGRNSGFQIESARIGVEAKNRPNGVTFRLSFEGTSDIPAGVNTPLGILDVRMRDAFVRWDPVKYGGTHVGKYIGVQVGQFKAPFAQEELRGVSDLLFASRAIGVEGVLVGRGFQERGVALDRQVGLMISPAEPIRSGPFGFAYYAMIMNGNGANQLLDDNGKPGFVGRVEGYYDKYVMVGGGVFANSRTVGTLPNLYDENDLGLAADIDVRVEGFEFSGQFIQIKTSYPTVGAKDRVQRAFHVQAGYKVPTFVPFTPAYRFAYYDPWASGGDFTTGQDYKAFQLAYHTFGVRVFHPTLPISGWVNYTVTTEPTARKLDNNRLEILGQITF